jgi:signal transduction histidine kinase
MTLAAAGGMRDAAEVGPPALRSAARLTFDSPIPACLVWGDAGAQIHNEPFAALCRRHLATTENADWKAKWPAAAQALERALAGHAVIVRLESWRDETPAPQRCSLTCSCTPVRDERGVPVGAMMSVFESFSIAELDTARHDLDALNYTLSHDLHSPIRTLGELAKILRELDRQAAPGDVDAFVTHLATGTAKLDHRVAALVKFARVSRQPLRYSNVNMAHLVETIHTRLAGRYPSHREALVVGELPAVAGDEELLGQAIEALLANAFKFTRHCGIPRVEIDAVRESDQIVYSVADNGVGFDMKFASKLFGLFQRLHSETEFEGIGVDLALAKRIIERHGGSLQATARPREGATFRFTLPALALPREPT